MGRACLICNHEDRRKIEQDLVTGAGYRNLSRRYEVSSDSIRRHAQAHLPQTDLDVAEALAAENLVGRLAELHRDTMEIRAQALASGNHALALKAIQRAEHQLVIGAQLMEQVASKSAPTIDNYPGARERIDDFERFQEIVQRAIDQQARPQLPEGERPNRDLESREGQGRSLETEDDSSDDELELPQSMDSAESLRDTRGSSFSISPDALRIPK